MSEKHRRYLTYATFLGLFIWLCSLGFAHAQNPTCPTRPYGDNSNACASTAFVQDAVGNPSANGFVVTAYGAVCDGITDDSAAVQAAVNAAVAAGGGNVIFPRTCVAGNINVGAGVTVTGGEALAPSTGANFIFHPDASRASVQNMVVQDGDGSANPVLHLEAGPHTITEPLTASVAAAGIYSGGTGWTPSTSCLMVDTVTNGTASLAAIFAVTTNSTGVINSIVDVNVGGIYTVLPGEVVGDTQQIFNEPVSNYSGCGSGSGASFALTFTTSTSIDIDSTAATATAPAVQIGQRFAIRSDDGIWSSGMITGIAGDTITVDRAPRHPSSVGQSFKATYGSIYVGGVNTYSSACAFCTVANVNMVQGGLMFDSDVTNSVTGFASNDIGGGHVFCTDIGRNTFGIQAIGLTCNTHWNPDDTYTGDGSTATFALSQRLRILHQLTVTVNNVVQTIGTNYTVASTGQSVTFLSGSIPASGANIQFSYQAMAADGLVVDGPGAIVTNTQALGFDRAFYITGPQSPQMSDLIADASIEACYSLDGVINAVFRGSNSVGFCDTGLFLIASHAQFTGYTGLMSVGLTPQGQANLMLAADGTSGINSAEWAAGGYNWYRSMGFQSNTSMNEVVLNTLPVSQYGIGDCAFGGTLPGIWNFCGSNGNHAYIGANATGFTFDGTAPDGTATEANSFNSPGTDAISEVRAQGTGGQVNISAASAINLGVAPTTQVNGFPKPVMTVMDPNTVMLGQAFSNFPACSASTVGFGTVIDSTTSAWGATITGGGGGKVLAFCDGTNWTVAGK